MTFVAALIWMIGFVVGLGAVSVIETIGFLAQRSSYWTEATIRTHKVTKPLIWLGLGIAIVGGSWYYALTDAVWTTWYHAIVACLMVINGSFLSFWISPRLLQREKEGRAKEILPKSWKTMITFSFLISMVTWWSAFVLTMWVLLK